MVAKKAAEHSAGVEKRMQSLEERAGHKIGEPLRTILACALDENYDPVADARAAAEVTEE